LAVTTDLTLTHIRRVGTSKGPAVQTVRAQVCKVAYPKQMRRVLEAQPGLTLVEDEVTAILQGPSGVTGVRLRNGGEIGCRALVLTTGTFLNGLCHEGNKKTVAARHGDQAVVGLGAELIRLGVRMRRFKTGTTPRVRLSSLRLERTAEMPSEPEAGALSFLNAGIGPGSELLPTWQTRTTEATHAVLRANLHQSAMFSGDIEGTGPRYCPSVEDKVVRFADKDSHPVFLEIEEQGGESVYVQGFSTSLPADVQLQALRTVPGLEEAEMLRAGYAVEYDMADPLQLDASLMSHCLAGLFLAGQLNGTSGYEEAAGQGIVAGINAARWATGEGPVTFPRTDSFIGVMVDDLVTKGVEDPYRMLTARAEHRLLLRHDNADQRLTPLGREVGTVEDRRWATFEAKMEALAMGRLALTECSLTETESSRFETARVRGRASLADLLRRPEVRLRDLEAVWAALGRDWPLAGTQRDVLEQLEIEAVYAGYLDRQETEAEQLRQMDSLAIPTGLALESLPGISHETREKWARVRPTTVGQASRVPGVRPSDVALLIGHVRGRKGSQGSRAATSRQS
jgi:tRNA uridine 5-carboxymethylaminomethyl modification enzyme